MTSTILFQGASLAPDSLDEWGSFDYRRHADIFLGRTGR